MYDPLISYIYDSITCILQRCTMSFGSFPFIHDSRPNTMICNTSPYPVWLPDDGYIKYAEPQPLQPKFVEVSLLWDATVSPRCTSLLWEADCLTRCTSLLWEADCLTRCTSLLWEADCLTPVYQSTVRGGLSHPVYQSTVRGGLSHPGVPVYCERRTVWPGVPVYCERRTVSPRCTRTESPPARMSPCV